MHFRANIIKSILVCDILCGTSLVHPLYSNFGVTSNCVSASAYVNGSLVGPVISQSVQFSHLGHFVSTFKFFQMHSCACEILDIFQKL